MALERGGGTAFPTWQQEDDTRLGNMYSCSGYYGKLFAITLYTTLSIFFYLSVFVQNVSEEAVGVWESLRASALPDADHPVLLRMQHTSLKQNIFKFSFVPQTGNQ